MEIQTKKGRWLTNVGLSLMAVIWLFPIFVMFKESLRVNGFDNYIATLQNPNFPQFVLKQFHRRLFHDYHSISFLAFAAFGFSKLQFAGKRLLFNLVLAGLMLPVASLIVPLFFTLRTLDGLNSYWGSSGPRLPFSSRSGSCSSKVTLTSCRTN